MSAATRQPAWRTEPQRREGRRRAKARNRALARLSREFVDRYRVLYREELEASA